MVEREIPQNRISGADVQGAQHAWQQAATWTGRTEPTPAQQSSAAEEAARHAMQQASGSTSTAEQPARGSSRHRGSRRRTHRARGGISSSTAEHSGAQSGRSDLPYNPNWRITGDYITQADQASVETPPPSYSPPRDYSPSRGYFDRR